MTIKTWEDRYNAAGIVSGHITDHMQAEITELRARVASDAITMMRLAGMSQDCALKAKGLEEHLEIAQGTLKNLQARVAELEAELATAKRGIECYAMQLAKDTVQSDIDCIMAQGVEIAQLKAELVAIRNQQPVAYRAWFDKDSGARFLFTLWPEEEQLDVDWESLFLAAGAHPSMKDHEIAALVNRLTDIAKEYAGAGQLRERIAQEIRHITKGAQPVPEGMAIMPNEPTLEMIDATGATMPDMREMDVADYKAMLAAAKETK